MRSASKRLRLAPASRCASIRAILLGASVVESALRGRLFTSVGSPFFISAFLIQLFSNPGFNLGRIPANGTGADLAGFRKLAPAHQLVNPGASVPGGLLYLGQAHNAAGWCGDSRHSQISFALAGAQWMKWL